MIAPGTQIVNPLTGTSGAIGAILIDPAGDLWILSCYHVLIRPPRWIGAPHTAPEPIMAVGGTGSPIAWTSPLHAHPSLDCAAARLDPAAPPVSLDIPTIGRPTPLPLAPSKLLKLIKFGPRSGTTRGVIQATLPTGLRIGPQPGIPAQPSLTQPGDSGSLWIDQATLSPVALHCRGNLSGIEFSFSTPLAAVLTALSLQLAM